jgi:hypothetical protein
MLQSDTFNADHFFSQGWVATSVNQDVADRAIELVENQRFRKESKVHSTNPMLPEWDSADSKKTSDNKAPPELVALWDDLLQHPYFDYWRLVYGEFSQKTVLLHQHNQGVKLPFHNDVHEGLHVTNVLFLTRSSWMLEFGGNLEFGRWRLNQKWWGEEDSVIKTGEAVASHGVLVSICNVVPTFCHAVSEMKADLTRYSLISRCGYKENVDGNKLSVLF